MLFNFQLSSLPKPPTSPGSLGVLGEPCWVGGVAVPLQHPWVTVWNPRVSAGRSPAVVDPPSPSRTPWCSRDTGDPRNGAGPQARPQPQDEAWKYFSIQYSPSCPWLVSSRVSHLEQREQFVAISSPHHLVPVPVLLTALLRCCDEAADPFLGPFPCFPAWLGKDLCQQRRC